MNISKTALYTGSGETLIVSASETIRDMFANTDKESGILYIPKWPYGNECDGGGLFLKCHMKWSTADRDDAVNFYETLYDRIRSFSQIPDILDAGFDSVSLPENLRETYDLYVRDFATGDIDMELVNGIEDRYEIIDTIRGIEEEMENGMKISPEEASFYNGNKDTSVSDDEKALYDRYVNALHADARHRIGDSPAAYDVIIRFRRVLRLMAIGAPDVIIEDEARILAQAAAVHKYCTLMETVSDVE